MSALLDRCVTAAMAGGKYDEPTARAICNIALSEAAGPKVRLADLRIEEASLVDAGDNPGAHIVFFKRRKEQRIMSKDIGKSKGALDKLRELFGKSAEAKALLDELAKAAGDGGGADATAALVAELEACNTACQACMDALQAVIDSPDPTTMAAGGKAASECADACSKAAEKLGVKAEVAPTGGVAPAGGIEMGQPAAIAMRAPAAKAMSPEMKKALDDMAAEVKKAREENAALSKSVADSADASKRADVEKRVKAFRHIPIGADKLAELLHKVATGKASATDATELEGVIRAQSEAVKTAALFGAGPGHSGDGEPQDSDPGVELDKIAKGIMAEKKIGYAQAFDAAITANQELAARYLQN